MICVSFPQSGAIRALVLAGVFAIGLAASAGVAAPAMTGLHIVPSPFINNSSLSGAAALADNDLWAVGAIATGSGANQALAEHFNGASWTVVPTPALNGLFAGVAGAAGNDVWAVGQQAQGSFFLPLIEHWNGATWSVVPGPKLPHDSELRAVTAPASNSVWATGVAGGSSDAPGGALGRHELEHR